MNIINNKLLKDNGIIDIRRPRQQIPKGCTMLREDLYQDDKGSIIPLLKGANISVITLDGIKDTYVYPITNEAIVEAARQIKSNRLLPIIGPISMSEVNVELKRPATSKISLGEYEVRNLALKQGAVTIAMSDLHGRANEYILNLSGTRANVSVSALIPTNIYNTVTVIVAPNSIIHSTATNIPAINFDGVRAKNVNLIIQSGATVVGRGGKGGNGRNNGNINGGTGGPAVSLGASSINKIIVTLHSNTVFGGGGGGGGGGDDDSTRGKRAGGGGGGGGAGYGTAGSNGGSKSSNGGNGSHRVGGGGGAGGHVKIKWGSDARGDAGASGGGIGKSGGRGRGGHPGSGGQGGVDITSAQPFTKVINRA